MRNPTRFRCVSQELAKFPRDGLVSRRINGSWRIATATPLLSCEERHRRDVIEPWRAEVAGRSFRTTALTAIAISEIANSATKASDP